MTQLAQDKNCYCHTCKKGFNSLGISSHRSIHRKKGENCTITYSNGKTLTHYFAKEILEITEKIETR